MSERKEGSSWFFDTWSGFYDLSAVQALVYRPVHDAVLARLEREGPQRVLDLACGTGLLTVRLKRELGIAHVIGADYSTGMLEQARRGRDDIEWVRASASSLPFDDASLDAITSTEAFHWFPDQGAALGECRRVLRPGGLLLVAFVNVGFEWMGDLAWTVSNALGQPARWPTMDGMRAMVEEAGFVVEDQRRVFRPFGMLVPPVLTVARRP
jgi:ubiquinone/menaquinone biosynthesis C-methylase UbiE